MNKFCLCILAAAAPLLAGCVVTKTVDAAATVGTTAVKAGAKTVGAAVDVTTDAAGAASGAVFGDDDQSGESGEKDD